MDVQRVRPLVWVFIVAVSLNYLWELAQAPLYVGLERYTAGVFWHCFVASLGDGIMVLLIYLVGWITLQRQVWFEHPGVSGHGLMLAAGLFLAILVEWLGVHVLGRWQYTDRMPLLPGLGLGSAPIAQMLLLPPLIFQIVAQLRTK